MLTKKFFPDIVRLSYFVFISFAFFQSNAWFLLAGVVAHIILYGIYKATQVLLESPKED